MPQTLEERFAHAKQPESLESRFAAVKASIKPTTPTPPPPAESFYERTPIGKLIGAASDVLQQPLSKTIGKAVGIPGGGYSASEVAQVTLPEIDKPGFWPTAYNTFLSRPAKLAGGLLDWIQTPEGVAVTAATGGTGALAFTMKALLGAQFATEGGKEALHAAQDIRKTGLTPENAEQFLMGMAVATGGVIAPVHAVQPVKPKLMEPRPPTKTEQKLIDKARLAYEARLQAAAKTASREAGIAEAATRQTQAQRRATATVPETTVAEDPTLRFSEAELDVLTRPEAAQPIAALETRFQAVKAQPADAVRTLPEAISKEPIVPTKPIPPLIAEKQKRGDLLKEAKLPEELRTQILGELPPKKAPPKRVKTEELPPLLAAKQKTPYELAIQDTAEVEMKNWAEDVRNVQQQLKRGESAMTTESNVEGKAIEETATKMAASIKSLGVKEGSPLAGFKEAPGLLASTIEGGRGKLATQIRQAFLEHAEAKWGEKIKAIPEEQLAEIYGPPKTAPLLGTTPAEAMALAAAGRRPELLKEGKTFDETRLVQSELFAGRGGPQKQMFTAEDISFNFGENALKRLDTAETATREAIKKGFEDLAKGATLGAGLPTELMGHLVKYGAIKLAKGSIHFAQWSAEMVAEFGKEVRPYLKSIYNDALKQSKEGTLPDRQALSTAKLLFALKRAGASRRDLEAAYRTERSERAGKISTIMAEGQGEESFNKALGALKGEMAPEKKTFDPLKLEEEDVFNLFNEIQLHPKLLPFDKISTADGLRQLLSGRVPKRSQLDLLQEVFGAELVKTVNQRRPWLSKAGNFLMEAGNVSRQFIASVDMSAPFRQGVVFITRGKAVAGAAKEMFRQVFSQKNFDAWMETTLPAHPLYKVMQDSGLYIADTKKGTPLAAREERFMSEFAQKIPWIKASNRAYTAYLNKLRVDVFTQYANKFMKEGVDPANPKDAIEFSSLADFVNHGTGRGALPKMLEGSAPVLNTIFFAPRLMASRINLMNPVWYSKQTPAVRKMAVRQMGEFVGLGLMTLALAKAGGAEVEADPRSTDFGKIKIGNSRWDIWGGFQQYARVLAQLTSGYRKSAKGDIQKLSAAEFPFDTRLNVAARFTESKLAPGPALIADLLRGQKLFGEELTFAGETAEKFVPLYLQDMKEAIQEQGPEAILTVGVPGFFGVGVQTYQERPPTTAIHSTIADSISSETADALMKAKVSVGAVQRRETDKNESAEALRTRRKLVGALINQRVGRIVANASYATATAEVQKRRIETAVRGARDQANAISKRTFADETERLRVYQEEIKARSSQ